MRRTLAYRLQCVPLGRERNEGHRPTFASRTPLQQGLAANLGRRGVTKVEDDDPPRLVRTEPPFQPGLRLFKKGSSLPPHPSRVLWKSSSTKDLPVRQGRSR